MKTEFRWKTLRTKWHLGLKYEKQMEKKKKQKSDKLIESFTTAVDRAVRRRTCTDRNYVVDKHIHYT